MPSQLLTVFVLTAIAMIVAQLMPPVRELRAFALLLDCVPLGGVVVTTVITGMRLGREPGSLGRLVMATYCYFAGALVGTLGVAHSVAVVMRSIDRARQLQFAYTFHLYSLLLLGAILIVAGFIAAIQATSLIGGDRAAWRVSLSVWTVILAINLPLIPLQRFAILFSVLAAVALLITGAMRRHFDLKSTPDASPGSVIG